MPSELKDQTHTNVRYLVQKEQVTEIVQQQIQKIPGAIQIETTRQTEISAVPVIVKESDLNLKERYEKQLDELRIAKHDSVIKAK
jgi:hypothetical protein